ncbi:hypothetical protein B0T19DRAFT_422616 [Cercophora scortea]|uniref:ATP-dependent DNA ligase family profile domain-containing protein n=1 Tax=Cercophora scortea TaxID=314031 RepID=A0AAE0INQ0_9PEZI|nr:hypothetical protein B0T19DRAFT_422616 [Cercophora scortea]
MPFPFSHVCDLLQCLEEHHGARPGLRSNADIVREWFARHRSLLDLDDHNDAALLSTLIPERRTDRVYLIREKKLQTLVGRGLLLGVSRIRQLSRWNQPGSGVDLAQCVESILQETPNAKRPAQREVTVEEIDEVLNNIAAACRFSSPAVRKSASNTQLTARELDLGNLFKRLSARDAKWLTRLVLKNFEPVVLDPHTVYRNYHPLLPLMLKVQDDLVVAGRFLALQRREQTVTGGAGLKEFLKPTLGIKVGRQPWIKGRSIKHCLDMSRGRMSVEDKIDGEYCQIHIDLSKGPDCIQIFSKSGKDSTQDRAALHSSIRNSLQLYQPSCLLKKGCILEGELVVYSDKEEKILDLYKVRKYVSRSGSFIGTGQDSQTHHWEHLMIVYYDLLMVDDESLLTVKRSERFQRLKDLVVTISGRSMLVRREIIDSEKPSAASDLRRLFAKCITARQEGLVLKPDDPYFDFDMSRRPYSCCAIKLKKEYVGGFGDIGDFAVVGARYDAAKAQTYGITNLKWTHFYVGCLENKDEVERFKKKPKFVVTNVVELNTQQLKAFIRFVNPESVSETENDSIILRVEAGVDNGKYPSVIFPTPPVLDLRCFSFEKVGNTGFWSPRFPMVNRIHCDRTFHDTLSFAELQEMAIKEKEMPPPEDSQELLGWIAALEAADPKTAAVVASSQLTQSTVSTDVTASTQSTNRSEQEPSPALQSPKSHPVEAASATYPAGTLIAAVPKSSEIHSINDGTSKNIIDNHKKPIQGQKRPFATSAGDPPVRPKVRRCSEDQTAATCSPSMSFRASPASSQREPLSSIRASSSRRNTEHGSTIPRLAGVSSMYQPSLGDRILGEVLEPDQISQPTASVSFHRTFAAAPPRPSSAAELRANYSRTNDGAGCDSSAKAAETTSTGSMSRCRYLPDSCMLYNYSFLLSPCISGFLLVMEDLLPCHGVTDFINDPQAWVDGASDGLQGATASIIATRSSTTRMQENDTASASSTIKSRRNKRKKAVLVDSRRKEATDTFLKRVEAAGLRRSNGAREYVPVYDWRVLEVLRDEEEKCRGRKDRHGSRFAMESSQSIWKRFWVGLA